jgi:hypothetical protein
VPAAVARAHYADGLAVVVVAAVADRVVVPPGPAELSWSRGVASAANGRNGLSKMRGEGGQGRCQCNAGSGVGRVASIAGPA